MNKHGFTLMEILAVLLVLAVVTSFAVPMIRKVRDEVYHSRAKANVSKMADAVRSYYQNTKGYLPSNGAICGSAKTSGKDTMSCTVVYSAGSCSPQKGADGVVATPATRAVAINLLFGCRYLAQNDFADLPYVFEVNSNPFEEDTPWLAKATGMFKAGKYKAQTLCAYRDGSIKEGC